MGTTIKDAALGKDDVTIADLYYDHELVELNEGGHKTECPSCGLQGDRTQGLILFADGKRAYCHSSLRNFGLLEAYALKKGIIKCADGRETGEKGSAIPGELFTETLEELKEEFDTELYEKIVGTAGVRTRIEIPGDGVLESDFAYKVGQKLKDKEVMYYRPEMQKVVEITKTIDIKDEEEFGGMAEVKPHRFVTLIEMYFKPYRTKYGKDGGVVGTPDKSINGTTANICMSASKFRDHIKQLNRIFTVPIPIIKDGELIFPRRGYDERFRSYLPSSCPHISEIQMGVEEAKALIYEIYEEFCFKEEQSRVNAIAALLTPFCRGLFPKFSTRAPVFAYTANKERAGKDYCANITGLLYEGVALEEPPINTGDKGGDNNNELRKKVFTAMMQGRKRLHFSNNKGHINSAVFESVTTSENYSDRVLGSSTMYSFPNEIDYSLSGNIDVSLSPDLLARSRMVELHLAEEDPNERRFNKPDLHGWVVENRDRILSALFALVRNWIEQGMPQGNTFTSFSRWADVVGGIMKAAEMGDPCVKNDSPIANNPANRDFKILWEDCYEKYPNEWITRDQINVVIAENGDIFTWYDKQDSGKNMSFWKQFRAKRDTYFTGILMKGDNNKKSQREKFAFLKNRPAHPLQRGNTQNGQVGAGPAHAQNLGTMVIMREQENLPKPALPAHLPNPIVPKIKIQTEEYSPKESSKTKPEKNDRQVQFWDAPECEPIKSEVEKDTTLNEIKSTPGQSYEELYDKLGNGTYPLILQLINDNTLEERDGKIYLRK